MDRPRHVDLFERRHAGRAQRAGELFVVGHRERDMVETRSVVPEKVRKHVVVALRFQKLELALAGGTKSSDYHLQAEVVTDRLAAKAEIPCRALDDVAR